MLLVKIILGGVLAIIAPFLCYLMWPVSLPELKDIARVEVQDMYNHTYFMIDDSDLVASFVLVANKCRQGWHVLAFIEIATYFTIRFIKNGELISDARWIQIAPRRAYQHHGKRLMSRHHPSAMFERMLPLVRAAMSRSKV